MATRLVQQPERLSYTKRDIAQVDEEVNKFLPNFIPRIKNTGKANVGRLFLRIMEALVDKLNYSLDMRFRQSVLRTVTEKQAAIDLTEIVRYKPAGISSATVDLDVTTLQGPAEAGGISIPQYAQFFTKNAPIKSFLALQAVTIQEGASDAVVQAVQGIRVVDQIIRSAALGDRSEEVKMPVAKTPEKFLEVSVNGVQFTRKDDLKDSNPEDRHYYVKTDQDDFSILIFGDGVYGTVLTPGSQITATYIQSLGEDGNTPKETITKVVGNLSALLSCNNAEIASGGSDGDAIEDIQFKAPRQASTAFVASNDRTFEALAESLVSGVFRAIADPDDGPVMNLYIMPNGGGVASTSLLNDVTATLKPRMIHGMTLNTLPLSSAHVLINVDVILQVANVNKSVVRKKLYELVSAFKLDGKVNPDGALYFRNLKRGRGFALSDIAALLEGVDNAELVDFVNFTTFTRYPTPIASNPSAPEFQGDIVPLSPVLYNAWSVQAVSTTEFYVYKDGTLDSSGTIGVSHTTKDGSLSFTLGEADDTFTDGDTWTFSSSSYANNIRIGSFEFMELARSSDLRFTIYYPNEYTIGQ